MYVRRLGGEVVHSGSVTQVTVDEQTARLERVQGAVDGRLVDFVADEGVDVVEDGGRCHVLTVTVRYHGAYGAPGCGDPQSLAA